MSDGIVIRQSFGDRDLACIRSLRYEILRKPLGLPPSGAIFPGDDSESTVHLLAYFENALIGCATLIMEQPPGIQLRGMAVSSDWQNHGVGKRIVKTAVVFANSIDESLWCNARFSAIGFYERLGWRQFGEFFDVPIIGQHILMKWSGNSEISD